MKKLKLIVLVIILFSGFSFVDAQAYTGAGDKKAQAGFSFYGNGMGINGTFDYGLHEYFSVGAGAELYFDNENSNNFFLYGRGNAHLGKLLNMPENMDLYPGLDLGVIGGRLGIGGHLGYRYFFNDKLGLYIELGNRGSAGVSFNL